MTRRTLPFKVEVQGPCKESWEGMSGTASQRHCESCNRQVHNFAAMTPIEIERLVAETGGHLCGRLTRREDGSLVTLPPAAFGSRLAALGLSVVLSATPAVFAQSDPASLQKDQTPPSTIGAFSLAGTVRGIQGGLIVGADVAILRGSALVAQVKTDTAGAFSLLLPSGEYQLRATASGFSHFAAPISAAIDNAAVADVTLKPSTEVTVNVSTSSPTFDATTGGVIAVSYGPWYRRLEFHLRHPILYLKNLFHHD